MDPHRHASLPTATLERFRHLLSPFPCPKEEDSRFTAQQHTVCALVKLRHIHRESGLGLEGLRSSSGSLGRFAGPSGVEG